MRLPGPGWGDLDLRDPATATLRFTHQVDGAGKRVPLEDAEEAHDLLRHKDSTVTRMI